MSMQTRVLKYSLLSLASAATLFVAYLWWALLSPHGYQMPEDLPPINPDIEHRVFVYGTLRHGWIRWLIIGQHPAPRSATLANHRREGLNVVPDPEQQVAGLVLDVEPGQLARLDRYERLGIRYDRIEVILADGSRAWIYQRR